jgi:hypothetical protein
MKLSIDDLRVDSYATQVSDLELTEVKGGTSWPCALVPVVIQIVVEVVKSATEAPKPAATETKIYGYEKSPDGTVKADSIVIRN